MGIDYGTRRVGIAISDERGSIAFPRGTLRNDRTLVPLLIDLVRGENIDIIVIGESKDKDGNDNPIMVEVRHLIAALENSLSVSVILEPEYYSSVEARRMTGDSFVDDKAAAVILNRYLERSNGTIN